MYYFSVFLLVPYGEYVNIDMTLNDDVICSIQADQNNSGSGDSQAASCSVVLDVVSGKWRLCIYTHVSVILFTGGGFSPLHAGIHHPSSPGPGTSPRDQAPPLPPGTQTPWEQTPREQTPPWSRHLPGADTPHSAMHAGRYGQQAGGTHPTGMQSCFYLLFVFKFKCQVIHYVLLIVNTFRRRDYGGENRFHR